MITIDAMGQACPIPMLRAKEAIEQAARDKKEETVTVYVDNEVAVQNIRKMAERKKCAMTCTKAEEKRFEITITVPEGIDMDASEKSSKKSTVVAVSSDHMGEGDITLGRTLLKGFLFALTQQEALPDTILFYNGGAALTCEGSESLEDLQRLAEAGVRILTCGTCLNHYKLTEKLKIGEVTNMYDITERLLKADTVVKP